MSGRVLESKRGRVGGGRREELEYLNNLAPCGWDDRSVILKEGPAAREMRACNETLACLCVALPRRRRLSAFDLASIFSLSNQAGYREGLV